MFALVLPFVNHVKLAKKNRQRDRRLLSHLIDLVVNLYTRQPTIYGEESASIYVPGWGAHLAFYCLGMVDTITDLKLNFELIFDRFDWISAMTERHRGVGPSIFQQA